MIRSVHGRGRSFALLFTMLGDTHPQTKHFKIIGCAVLSLICALSSNAQSVSSTPVGYVTLTINGNGYTALSNPLENAVVYSGTASSVSGSTITSSFSMTDSELSGTDPNGSSTCKLLTESFWI